MEVSRHGGKGKEAAVGGDDDSSFDSHPPAAPLPGSNMASFLVPFVISSHLS